ncbi:hypothetical protein [uncultured Kordia sp.]|uniref:hypothetical protein n=1 Tax=uncultured Kordia sp. TaxID=507699 RepID=UPI0026034742|nr:hypothetical protein [uncultured Kordia sp.]
MKRIVFLLLVIFYSCQTVEKKEDFTEFKRISLSFKHLMSCKSLIVHIEKYPKGNIDVRYKYTPHKGCNADEFSFKSYSIDSIQFEKITESILKIDRSNIEKESQTMGLDGISTSITFYEKNKNTIMNVYDIWTPTDNTEKRKLNDYMSAYKTLVKLAHIDADSLF